MKPIKYGASWKSTAVKAANVADVVFSAAANARGAIVWRASVANSSGEFRVVFLAKAGVPVDVSDGDAILTIDSAANGNSAQGKLEIPVFIPPGKGLYLISAAGITSGAMSSVLYDLL